MTDRFPRLPRQILRDLPRQKVIVLFVILLLHASLVVWVRGRVIGRKRPRVIYGGGSDMPGEWASGWRENDREMRERAGQENWCGPWEWTADEWRETVWIWK